jgi:hypothetical protein
MNGGDLKFIAMLVDNHRHSYRYDFSEAYNMFIVPQTIDGSNQNAKPISLRHFWRRWQRRLGHGRRLYWEASVENLEPIE